MIIYLDVLLLQQFVINMFVLVITGVIRQRKIKISPIIGTSLVFSIVSTGIYILSIKLNLMVSILTVLEMIIIPRLAFVYEGVTRWKKDCFCFFFVAIFLGGMMEAIFHFLLNLGLLNGSKLTLTYVYIGLAGIGISFLLLFSHLMQCKREVMQFGRGTIIHGKQRIEVSVLFDSGNMLISPYSQEHVAVISKGLAEKLDFSGQNPLLIPFSTVGGAGMMKAYRIDTLLLPQGNHRYQFLGAISKENTRADIIINTE